MNKYITNHVSSRQRIHLDLHSTQSGSPDTSLKHSIHNIDQVTPVKRVLSRLTHYGRVFMKTVVAKARSATGTKVQYSESSDIQFMCIDWRRLFLQQHQRHSAINRQISGPISLATAKYVLYSSWSVAVTQTHVVRRAWTQQTHASQASLSCPMIMEMGELTDVFIAMKGHFPTKIVRG